MTGLTYQDRTTGADAHVDLEGIFVQIGLLPNTEWLQRHGRAVASRRDRRSTTAARRRVPGVFAAGDCTTVPFKQIVIAMGQGATAALAAFDHLIRTVGAATPTAPGTGGRDCFE